MDELKTKHQNNMLRRDVMIGTALAVSAASLGLPFSKLKAAEIASAAAPDLATYAPVFFSAVEMKFLAAACDRLIPADEDGPGALACNVPVFIDQQMMTSYGKGEDWYMEGPHDPKAMSTYGYQLPYSLQDLYRRGMAAVDAHCRQNHQGEFASLDGEKRDNVLAQLEKGDIDFARYGEPVLNAKTFFSFLLGNTREGYLADPIYGGNKGMAAWVMIGFPGARASFLEWINQHNIKYPLGPVSLNGERA